LTAEGILLTVVMFFLLVGIHEFGHFYFAKRAGILVREFAIGFGPKVFSYKRKETRYTLRMLPIGGFVRMAGEDPEIVQINPGHRVAVRIEDGKVTRFYTDGVEGRADCLVGTVERIDLEKELVMEWEVDGERQVLPVHEQAEIVSKGMDMQIAPLNRQFGGKTVGQRSMAIFAGPMMNFILAFILFFTVVYMTGVPIGEPTTTDVLSVEQNSPADRAGVAEGDVIVSVNGEEIGVDRERLISLIQEYPDKEMEWVVLRNEELVTLQVTPANVDDVGKVGIGVGSNVPTRTPNPWEAVERSAVIMKDSTVVIFDGLKQLVTLQLKLDDLGGPVRITEVTGDAVERGMDVYVFWAGMLSLYLGIFNLLPFPALDGSRLLFLGLEAVRGRPVEPSRESMVHFIGFALLMVLMIAVTYNDILRLFRS